MATGGHAPEIDVLINLQQVEVEDEEGSEDEREEEEEEENWEKALSVERFGDIFSDSASTSGDRMGRHYTEKDFEYHRHTFHHTHHPLSTHLPLPQRLRKRVHSTDRKRKKKRKKKKTSLPPSEVTPTIHEVDEEEAESEKDTYEVAATPTELPDIQPQFGEPRGLGGTPSTHYLPYGKGRTSLVGEIHTNSDKEGGSSCCP